MTHATFSRVRTAICLAALLLMLLLAFRGNARAQQGTSGSIEGTVTDPQGAAISNAKLTAVSAETGLTLESSSDENGLFHFLVVPVGAYRITVERSGFAKYTASVTVYVGARINLPVQMALSKQTEAITVSAT